MISCSVTGLVFFLSKPYNWCNDQIMVPTIITVKGEATKLVPALFSDDLPMLSFSFYFPLICFPSECGSHGHHMWSNGPYHTPLSAAQSNNGNIKIRSFDKPPSEPQLFNWFWAPYLGTGNMCGTQIMSSYSMTNYLFPPNTLHNYKITKLHMHHEQEPPCKCQPLKDHDNW